MEGGGWIDSLITGVGGLAAISKATKVTHIEKPAHTGRNGGGGLK